MNNNEFSISRRKALAGLGMIGVASAGAGLGTTAFFSDEEELQAEVQAGRMDLLLDYRAEYYPWEEYLNDVYPRGPDERFDTDGDGDIDQDDEFGPVYVVGQSPDLRYQNDEDTDGDNEVDNAAGDVLAPEDWAAATRQIDACLSTPLDDGDNDNAFEVQRQNQTSFEATFGGGELPASGSDAADHFTGSEYVDGAPQVMFDLDDVKPKDAGEATISLHLCTNDAYLWTRPVVNVDSDNGVVEPEDAVDGTFNDGSDGTSDGDLDDYLHVRLWYDENCNNEKDAGAEGDAEVMIVLDVSGSMDPEDQPNKF